MSLYIYIYIWFSAAVWSDIVSVQGHWRVTKDALQLHLADCPKRPVECLNSGSDAAAQEASTSIDQDRADLGIQKGCAHVQEGASS